MQSGASKILTRYRLSQTDLRSDIPSVFPFITATRELGDHLNKHKVERWAKLLPPNSHNPDLPVSQLPARLIDLHGSGLLRGVKTCQLSNCSLRYAALSYVWEVNQTFVLSSTTEPDLKEDFNVNRLSQTLQEAVTTTRRVGLRYL